MSFPNVKYTGTTPGTDSSTYNLLNSHTAGWPGYWPSHFGIFKVVLDLDHSHAGTVNVYKTNDDLSVTSPAWTQTHTLAVAAPSAATGSSQVEVFVEAHFHTKIDWVNGGTAQSPWVVNISLSDQRASI